MWVSFIYILCICSKAMNHLLKTNKLTTILFVAAILSRAIPRWDRLRILGKYKWSAIHSSH
jgi:hypothetical protein